MTTLAARALTLSAFRNCVVALALACFSTDVARAQSPLVGDRFGAQDVQGATSEPQVSLEYFRERLSAYGAWLEHPMWGEVWRPEAGPNFRPYFDGYWEYTSDHGSLWISNEPFGDIVYHYGRWVFDRIEGWIWVPGYVWGPSWVVWRANQDYVGWLPMPPGYLDYQQLFASPYLADTWYGYRTFNGPIYGPTFVTEHYFTLWVFVVHKDLGHRGRHRHVTDIRKLRELYHGSKDRTSYAVDKDQVVDRSLDREWWQRRAAHRGEARPAKDHSRSDVPRTLVSQGRTILRRHAQARREDNFERDAFETRAEPLTPEAIGSARAHSSRAVAREAARTEMRAPTANVRLRSTPNSSVAGTTANAMRVPSTSALQARGQHDRFRPSVAPSTLVSPAGAHRPGTDRSGQAASRPGLEPNARRTALPTPRPTASPTERIADTRSASSGSAVRAAGSAFNSRTGARSLGRSGINRGMARGSSSLYPSRGLR